MDDDKKDDKNAATSKEALVTLCAWSNTVKHESAIDLASLVVSEIELRQAAFEFQRLR